MSTSAPFESAYGWANPFAPNRTEPLEAEVEAWARALCEASGAKPDKIIGFPPAPRWRSWTGYAVYAAQAARRLGYPPLADGTTERQPEPREDQQ